MSKFAFQAYDIASGTLHKQSDHSLLLHLNGDLQKLDSKNRIMGVINVPKMKILMWTMLVDKNKKRIFEDDIICLTRNGEEIKGVIKWSLELAGWTYDETPFGGSKAYNFTAALALKSEKVGNINVDVQ